MDILNYEGNCFIMKNMEEAKKNYLNHIYEEFFHRNISQKDAERVIAKTNFIKCLNQFPEVQMHCSIVDAVDEIMQMAALSR